MGSDVNKEQRAWKPGIQPMFQGRQSVTGDKGYISPAVHSEGDSTGSVSVPKHSHTLLHQTLSVMHAENRSPSLRHTIKPDGQFLKTFASRPHLAMIP